MVIRCPSLPLFPLLFIHHSRFPLDALFPSHSTLIFAIPVGWLHVSANNTLSSCNYFANLYPIPSSTHRHRPFTPHSGILNPFSLFSTITQASIKYTFVGGPRTVTVAGLFIFPVTVIFQTRTSRRINVPDCFWRAWKIRCRPVRHFSRSHPGQEDHDKLLRKVMVTVNTFSDELTLWHRVWLWCVFYRMKFVHL